MKLIFYHHEQHGPFSLQNLYAGQVQYAGTVARLRLLFWLAARGIEVVLIGNVEDGECKGVKSITGDRTLPQLLRQCSKDNPVFLILNNPPNETTWLHLQKLKRPGLFIILWAAGPFPVDWMKRVAIGDLARIICISQVQRDYYRFYHGFEKVEMAYLGIDLDLMPHEPLIQYDKNLVLSTSIPRRTKGFHHLLHAWKLVRKSEPNAQLRVCGTARMHDPKAILGATGILDSDLEAEFPEFFCNFPTSTKQYGIELMGARPLPDVYDDLYRARVAVVNTNFHGSIEMFCRSAVEAQMAGVPVVGAACGSLPEVIVHGKTGLLVASENYASLATSIITLLKDDNLCQSMGSAGPVWAQPLADYALIALEWEAIVQRCLRNVPAPAPKQFIPDLLRQMGYGQARLWLRDSFRAKR